MATQSNEAQFKTVFLRRGFEVEKGFPTTSIASGIEAGNLIATDQISTDGKNWFYLGQHKQLARLFNDKNGLHEESQKDLQLPATDKKDFPINDKLAIWFIRIAYTLAINTGFLTLITVVPKNPIHIIDVILSCVLSIGIYNRSLFCATAMLIYFLLSKGIQIFNISVFNLNEIIISSVLLIGYALGIFGILRIEKKERQARH